MATLTANAPGSTAAQHSTRDSAAGAMLNIGGVTIDFPFEPYAAQMEYMESVIDALNSGSNALLESPTGTGKTLCLLCSTLAWLLSRRAPRYVTPSSPHNQLRTGESVNPLSPSFKVIYCSRTHAQLTQVIRELKRTAYRDQVTMAVLGSKDHMCINGEATRLPTSQALRQMCGKLRSERRCRFFRNTCTGTGASLEMEAQVHDIEDLLAEGKRNCFCPYYYERERMLHADIVLMPYNYIIDPSLRAELPFPWKKCIVIVDEAHNLPAVLSDSGCLSLQPTDLTNAIHDCSCAIAAQRLAVEKGDPDGIHAALMAEQELASLKILLCQLESAIGKEKLNAECTNTLSTTSTATLLNGKQQQQPRRLELVRPGAYMFEFLEGVHLSHDVVKGAADSAGIEGTVRRACELLLNSERPAQGLLRVQQFLSAVYSDASGVYDESTRFIIQGQCDGKGGRERRTLCYWRLDSSAAMTALASSLHSMLLTSGTLSPIDHFAAELGADFGVLLKGSHVIEPEQLLSGVLCKGPGGGRLNGSYAFRSGVDYISSLGMTVVNMCRNTPGGTLVFFPSYAAMNGAVDLWRAGSGAPTERTVWGLLSELKPVFVEPAGSADLKAVIDGFQGAIDKAPSKGAVLLAVCRGKISEGIDFADNHGRCVVVTGIPYANHTDLFVRLKRQYLTQIAPDRPMVNGKSFTGDDWYRNEAMRAVNQCVGRVIRHKDDYGSVVLADERFSGELGSLSDWVARRTVVHKEFRSSFAAVARFFAERSGYSRKAAVSAAAAVVAAPHSGLPAHSNAADTVPPSSAAKARLFAEAQERRSGENEQLRQLRRLEDVRETPSKMAISTPGSPTTTSTSRGLECLTAAVPKMQRQTLISATIALQQDPSRTDAPNSTVESIGSTSREFCSYLKGKLSDGSYAAFRQALKDIATLRTVLATAPSSVLLPFTVIVNKLQALFREANSADTNVIVAEFSRHIPEEFRPMYARLIRCDDAGQR